MPSYDDTLKRMAESMQGMTKDIQDLKREVAKLRTQDGGGFYLPFGNYTTLGANITTTGLIPYITTLPRTLRLISWKQDWFVVSGDASNYWTIQFTASAGVLLSFDTKSGPFGVWNRYVDTSHSFLLDPTLTNPYVLIACVKTGTPGTLHTAHPAVFVV